MDEGGGGGAQTLKMARSAGGHGVSPARKSAMPSYIMQAKRRFRIGMGWMPWFSSGPGILERLERAASRS